MAKGSLRKENLFGKKKFGIEKLIFWVLFLSMLGSVVFVCIRLVQTWGDESKAQRDYKLMLRNAWRVCWSFFCQWCLRENGRFKFRHLWSACILSFFIAQSIWARCAAFIIQFPIGIPFCILSAVLCSEHWASLWSIGSISRILRVFSSALFLSVCLRFVLPSQRALFGKFGSMHGIAR